jgi:transposase
VIGLSRCVRVFAYTQPVDTRTQYNGLYALVVAELKADPLFGDLFLFTNRRRSRAKVLLWDGTGLCLDQKRLERDIERLRQAALLLEHEHARLFGRLESLASELREARGEDAKSLQLEIAHLKEQLANRMKALFGDSSERRPRAEHKTDERKETRRGHGPREQKVRPILEVVHELDEPDQACPSCGGDLQLIASQFEEADEIDVVERSFRIVRQERQKYRCRCGAGIERALSPDKLVAGGRYSIDFAVDVAIAKFADHLPSSRTVRAAAVERADKSR